MVARVCVRPGCDRVAVARLTYDTIACQVWLDPVPERPGPAQEICELHAARLTVPRGWVLSDRRPEEPARFVDEPAVNGTGTADVNGNGHGNGHAAPAPNPPAASAPEAARAVPDPAPARPEATEPVPAAGSEQLEPVHPARRRVARTVPLPVAQLVTDEAAGAAPHNGSTPPDAQAEPVGAAQEEPAAHADAPVADEAELDEPGTGETELDETELDEDLPESLQATSPLLARAFRLSGPQGSVLSRTLLNEPD